MIRDPLFRSVFTREHLVSIACSMAEHSPVFVRCATDHDELVATFKENGLVAEKLVPNTPERMFQLHRIWTGELNVLIGSEQTGIPFVDNKMALIDLTR